MSNKSPSTADREEMPTIKKKYTKKVNSGKDTEHNNGTNIEGHIDLIREEPDQNIVHVWENKPIESFCTLSYEDVQVNLRLLGDLKEDEKLMVGDDRFVMVDQRYAQSLRRWWTLDSRRRSIAFVEHIVEETQRYCKEIVNCINNDNMKKENMEKLVKLQTLLNGSLTGLGRLATTYSNDKLSRARIETVQGNIRTFCDLDLKNAIKNQ